MTEWSQREIDDVRYGTKGSSDELKKLNEKIDKSLQNDAALIDIFTKIAQKLDVLAGEIKGLREDLNPKLEKPKLGNPS